MGFTKLKVHQKLVEGLKLMGIINPTPIQEKCIPLIKAGKDVVGQSLTGSGKTAAFGLPILEKVVPGEGLQALILTPTRELCLQVRDSLETMGKFLPINIISIYGGVGFFDQTEGLKNAEIVVATPGRLLDHIGRRNTDFRRIKYVVLDEADKMFEMGFEEDVNRILSQTPQTRQTILFSATMPRAAQNVVQKYLRHPIFIQEKLHVDKTLLKQVFYSIRRDDKFSLLVHLLKQKTAGPAIVFCGTKREVDRIARNLRRQKIDAMPVHGDLTQNQRQRAVDSFKKGRIDVLVATDVAARGLDIKDVTHVYNYDVPRVPEDYTHRIGRTARAGKKGDAVTLVSDRDFDNFNKILRQKKFEIIQEQTPNFEKIEIQRHGFGEHAQAYGEREDRHGSRFSGERRPFAHEQERRDFGQGRRQYRDRFQTDKDYEVNNQAQRRNYGTQKRHFEKRRNHSFRRDNDRLNYKHRNSFNLRPQRGSFENRDSRQEPHRPRQDYAQHHQKELHNTPRQEEFNDRMERTPRTHEPLFPTSHYNPDHHKYKTKTHKRNNEQHSSHRDHNDSQREHKVKGKPHFFKEKNKKNFNKKKRF